MANAGPNTNGSQFFIVQGGGGRGLSPSYTIFGQVASGMDVVNAIAGAPVQQSASGEPSSPVRQGEIDRVADPECGTVLGSGRRQRVRAKCVGALATSGRRNGGSEWQWRRAGGAIHFQRVLLVGKLAQHLEGADERPLVDHAVRRSGGLLGHADSGRAQAWRHVCAALGPSAVL
jgi:hypothetical protein